MVAAPVGFQCRECVANANADISAPIVDPMSRPTTKYVPYVSYALIGICVALFVGSFVTIGIEAMVGQYGMRPLFIGLYDEWYRLVTSAFLHWSILHIGFNMLVLFMIGPALERIFGHGRFFALYLLAGIGGAVASYTFSPIQTASVGASGAIFGLMAALVVAGRRFSYDVRQVLILLGINLLIGFVPGGSIDWRAHLGGLVVGALVAAIFAYAPGGVAGQIGGCILILAVLGLITFMRTESLRATYGVAEPTPVVAAATESGTLGYNVVNARSYN